MNRLTKRNEVGEGVSVTPLNLKHRDALSEDTLTKILEKLAAYEDGGLEPDEMLNGLELTQIQMHLNQLEKYRATGLSPEKVAELSNILDKTTGGN